MSPEVLPQGTTWQDQFTLCTRTENEKVAWAMAMKFSFYDRVPEPLKCEFIASGHFIFVHFDKPVDCNKKWEFCERYITGSALNKLTKDSKCRCKKDKLTIRLQNSKLCPGDEMEFVLWYIQRKRSSYTKHFPAKENKMLTCNKFHDAWNPPEFKVEISAPDIIGKYKNIQITHRGIEDYLRTCIYSENHDMFNEVKG